MLAKRKRPTPFERVTFAEGGPSVPRRKVDLVSSCIATSPSSTREGIEKYLRLSISREVWDAAIDKRRSTDARAKKSNGRTILRERGLLPDAE